jgi:hypothetical protein
MRGGRATAASSVLCPRHFAKVERTREDRSLFQAGIRAVAVRSLDEAVRLGRSEPRYCTNSDAL